MSLQSEALQNFRDAQSDLGSEATYSRNGASVPIDVLPGRKDYQVTDSNGALIQFSSHDFLIARADLILESQETAPQRGDRIVRVIDDRRQEFEVSFPDRTQPPFRWSDPNGAVLRIHTVLVSDQPQ